MYYGPRYMYATGDGYKDSVEVDEHGEFVVPNTNSYLYSYFLHKFNNKSNKMCLQYPFITHIHLNINRNNKFIFIFTKHFQSILNNYDKKKFQTCNPNAIC